MVEKARFDSTGRSPLGGGGPPEPGSPPRIGNYDLCLENGRPVTLGTGGFGKTYLAVHSYLGKKAVIKLLNEDFCDDERIKERFFVEARSLAELDHPNIARLLDFGVDKGGEGERLYCAMEYGDLGDLEKYIANHSPLGLARALEFISQAAQALEYTHGKNMLHRDIKPSNFVLCNIQGETVLKVIDFGLVKQLGSDASKTLTQSGHSLISLYYASPEQIRKKALDVRSDIFSLGLTFWHMIEGVCPFQKEEPTIAALERADPEASYSSRLPHSLPKGVLDLLSSMVAFEPSRRPQSMREVGERAKRCLESLGPEEKVLRFEQHDKSIEEVFTLARKLEGFRASTYEATRKGSTETVCLRSFDIDHEEDSTTARSLHKCALAICMANPPYALRAVRLVRFTDCVVLQEEIGGGFTLKSLVSSTKGMTLKAALPLLVQLAQATDQLHKISFVRAYLRPENIFIQFPESSWERLGSKDPHNVTIAEWPRFLVRLQIDYLIGATRMADAEKGGVTVLSEEDVMDYVPLPKFAAMVYYVLAARRTNYRAQQSSYIKLPGLSEAGNDLLRSMIGGEGDYHQCTTFLRGLALQEGLVLPEAELPQEIRTLKGLNSTRTQSKAEATSSTSSKHGGTDQKPAQRSKSSGTEQKPAPKVSPTSTASKNDGAILLSVAQPKEEILSGLQEIPVVQKTGTEPVRKPLTGWVLSGLLVAAAMIVAVVLYLKDHAKPVLPNGGSTGTKETISGVVKNLETPNANSGGSATFRGKPVEKRMPPAGIPLPQPYTLVVSGTPFPMNSSVVLNGSLLPQNGTTLPADTVFPLKICIRSPGYVEMRSEVIPTRERTVPITFSPLKRSVGRVKVFLPKEGCDFPKLKLLWLSPLTNELGAPAPAGELEIALTSPDTRDGSLLLPSVPTGRYRASLTGSAPQLPDYALERICSVSSDSTTEISDVPTTLAGKYAGDYDLVVNPKMAPILARREIVLEPGLRSGTARTILLSGPDKLADPRTKQPLEYPVVVRGTVSDLRFDPTTATINGKWVQDDEAGTVETFTISNSKLTLRAPSRPGAPPAVLEVTHSFSAQ